MANKGSSADMEEHLKTWRGFVRLLIFGITGSVVVLAGMGIFLL